jgi:bifunctional DNA-binding transcriptional regulator/antitoxin component of YhaV-PrlF toxin-antitoxin module
MAKVTSKLQVTVPKALASQYGIEPGDEIEWEAAGDSIRVTTRPRTTPDRAARLRLFDNATARQKTRNRRTRAKPPEDRGWRRDELYVRGRTR